MVVLNSEEIVRNPQKNLAYIPKIQSKTLEQYGEGVYIMERYNR